VWFNICANNNPGGNDHPKLTNSNTITGNQWERCGGYTRGDKLCGNQDFRCPNRRSDLDLGPAPPVADTYADPGNDTRLYNDQC
jgi:hypothetical protein